MFEVITPRYTPEGALVFTRLWSGERHQWRTKRAAQRNADQYNAAHKPDMRAFVQEA